MPEASKVISKTFEKSERLVIGASVILSFISGNALAAALAYSNFPCFKQSVIRVMMVLKFRINCLQKVANP